MLSEIPVLGRDVTKLRLMRKSSWGALFGRRRRQRKERVKVDVGRACMEKQKWGIKGKDLM